MTEPINIADLLKTCMRYYSADIIPANSYYIFMVYIPYRRNA